MDRILPRIWRFPTETTKTLSPNWMHIGLNLGISLYITIILIVKWSVHSDVSGRVAFSVTESESGAGRHWSDRFLYAKLASTVVNQNQGLATILATFLHNRSISSPHHLSVHLSQNQSPRRLRQHVPLKRWKRHNSRSYTVAVTHNTAM